MSLLDSYRNSKITRQKELAKLTSDKAKEFVKLSELSKKINSSSDAMKRTKTVSTINSKLRDIERYNKEIANTNKKIADIESKIVRKEKEIFDYQIEKEQNTMDKRRKNESEKIIRNQEKSLSNINNTLKAMINSMLIR